MDGISTQRRSQVMAAIKSRNTRPELTVRRMLHAMGFRFRLHCKDLAGKPDIVLSKYKTIVLVNGCFWHQHAGCKFAKRPASHQEYWEAKLDRNIVRDKGNLAQLTILGWRVIIVWECELRDTNNVAQRLVNCLKNNPQILS